MEIPPLIRRAMRAIFAVLVLGLGSGCTRSDMLTPRQFAEEFAASLRQASLGSRVEIVEDLGLRFVPSEGTERTVFLDNAYTEYKLDPGGKADVIRRYRDPILEMVAGLPGDIDRTRIVPVIKDRPWVEEVRQSMLNRGGKAPDNVFEDLDEDLIIVYAEDSPKNIRYLTPDDLEKAKIERHELRRLACENLKRLLPPIEVHGGDGVYRVTAGGDYEASLLLIDSVWKDQRLSVRGDTVIAISTRDLLLVTGSSDQEGIEKLKKLARDSWEKGSHKLTPKLFVSRQGRWEEM